MDVTVKGKNLDVGDSLRQHVENNLQEATNKYFNHTTHATVVMSKEKDHLFRADISITVGRGIVLQAQHEANDPYPAFDVASRALMKRLKKYKDRLRDHHKRLSDLPDSEISLPAKYTAFQAAPDVETDQPDGGEESAVIADMNTQIPTLAVADAVMRLDLSDAPALMFKNATHGGFNMVYRRKDGNIGWVDPQNIEK